MTVEPEYADYDGGLDLQSVFKQNWKTAQSRDYWKPALMACREAYQELEIRAVADSDNPRQATILHEADIGNGELFDLSSELDVRVVFEDGESASRIAVASEKETAESALEADENDDHDELGRLLGFPDCCIEAHSGGRTPIYEIACRTDSCVEHEDREAVRVEDPDGMLNIIWAYLDWKFISHTPCSFDCEASREIATSHGRLYREMGLGDEAEKLWEFLADPLTWTGYHGLSNIRSGYCIGSTNTPPYWSEKKVVWGEEHESKKL